MNSQCLTANLFPPLFSGCTQGASATYISLAMASKTIAATSGSWFFGSCQVFCWGFLTKFWDLISRVMDLSHPAPAAIHSCSEAVPAWPCPTLTVRGACRSWSLSLWKAGPSVECFCFAKLVELALHCIKSFLMRKAVMTMKLFLELSQSTWALWAVIRRKLTWCYRSILFTNGTCVQIPRRSWIYRYACTLCHPLLLLVCNAPSSAINQVEEKLHKIQKGFSF